MRIKINLFLLIIFACLTITPTLAIPGERDTDSITVYVFLHESCVISQYYTLPLREMHQEYAHEQIQFVGLFPNSSSKYSKIQAFKKNYQIPFELKTDYNHTLTEALGATVTPEVVVYHEAQKKILYKGRIDDAYARVGQKKRVISTSELKDALEAIRNKQPIPISETKAVGCFINKKI